MNLPDPKDYTDGVQFFRDTHKVVLHYCAELERLLADAQANGVFASFAALPEWDPVFQFFLKEAPRHEREEERILFPLVASKVSRVGFQQPNAPIRFLIEGHDILQRQTEQLVTDWEAFRKQKRDPAALATAHSKHEQEDAAFLAAGNELVTLYRKHIAMEEERVYSVADKSLSGSDKLQVIDMLRAEHDNQASTPVVQFDTPQFTNPQYNIQYHTTDAQSDDAIDSDFAEGD